MSDRRMLDSFEKRRLCLVVELTVLGVTRCIILSTRSHWFVCFLLPRYMCNIVQKCPTMKPTCWMARTCRKEREAGMIT